MEEEPTAKEWASVMSEDFKIDFDPISLPKLTEVIRRL
jgi:hypothetical protein